MTQNMWPINFDVVFGSKGVADNNFDFTIFKKNARDNGSKTSSALPFKNFDQHMLK